LDFYERLMAIAPSRFVDYTVRARVEVLRDANVTAARSLLEEGWRRYDKREIRSALTHYITPHTLLTLEVSDGHYDAALDLLASYYPEAVTSQWTFCPKTQLIADVYRLMGQKNRALAYYDSARVFLEDKMGEDDGDPRVFSSLGYVYARLGRKEEAISMGERAVKLLPVSKDAILGPRHVRDLATIYTVVGEYDAAVERLEYVLSVPNWTSAAFLRVDPMWAPLRDHPGFQQLVSQ
jgi:tetratricopeptide (TPR) repeat protein